MDLQSRSNDTTNKECLERGTTKEVVPDGAESLILRSRILRKIDLFLLPMVRITTPQAIMTLTPLLDVHHIRISVPRQSNPWLCCSIFTHDRQCKDSTLSTWTHLLTSLALGRKWLQLDHQHILLWLPRVRVSSHCTPSTLQDRPVFGVHGCCMGPYIVVVKLQQKLRWSCHWPLLSWRPWICDCSNFCHSHR